MSYGKESTGGWSITNYQVFALCSNIVTSISIFVLYLVFETVISPFKSGFFCDDESIMKPHLKKQTISALSVAVLAILFVLVVIVVCDSAKRFLLDTTEDLEVSPVARKLRLKQWIFVIIKRVNLGLIGLGFCIILVGMMKAMVGRLRPHFLDVCKPYLSNCTKGVFMDFSQCSVTTGKAFREARKSFPSGHAAASAYVTAFFALYIEYGLRPKHFYLLKPFIQFTAVLCGIAVGLTRIQNYFHHWSDVLAGLLLGYLFAYYTIFRLLELPKVCEDEEKKKSFEEESTHCLTDVANNYDSTSSSLTRLP